MNYKCSYISKSLNNTLIIIYIYCKLLDPKEEKRKIQEFRSKFRYEPNKEIESIVTAKCALIEVIEVFWKFQTNSLLSVSD